MCKIKIPYFCGALPQVPSIVSPDPLLIINMIERLRSLPYNYQPNKREDKREDLKEKSQEKQSAKIQSTLPIITASLIRGAFRTLSNIYDGAFCENNGRHTHMTSTLRGSVLDVQSLFFYYGKFFNKSHPLMIPLHCLWT